MSQCMQPCVSVWLGTVPFTWHAWQQSKKVNSDTKIYADLYYSDLVVMLNELITRRDNIMYNLPSFAILTNIVHFDPVFSLIVNPICDESPVIIHVDFGITLIRCSAVARHCRWNESMMGQYIRYLQTARMPMKWEKNIVQPA
jgi:hypothetical protein